MGDETPNEDPTGDCAVCCDEMPSSMYARIELVPPVVEPFVGLVPQHPNDNCRYTGYIYSPDGGYVMFDGSYCVGGEEIARLGCTERPFCVDKTVIFAHPACLPMATGESPGGGLIFSIT